MDSKPISDSVLTASQHKKAQRYRLILSDGKHFLPCKSTLSIQFYFSFDQQHSLSACVLTVQLNELVANGQLQEYSIIRLDRYLRNDLKGQATKYDE